MFSPISEDFKFAEGFVCMYLHGGQSGEGGIASAYLIILMAECDPKLA